MPEPPPSGPSLPGEPPSTLSVPSQPAPPLPPDPAELLRRLHNEQWQRWQKGERILVEALLARHPELRNNPEGVLDLVYGEVLLREQLGEQPRLEEYLQRFPEYSAPLRRQFEIHEELETGSLVSARLEQTPGPSVTPLVGRDAMPVVAPAEATIQFVDEGAPGDKQALGRLGDYVLLDELGRGGMGVVYKAYHTKLKRVAALKMILSGKHAGAGELTRFKAEAQAIARLQHPHIVQIFEVGEHDGQPFLALEFLEGGSLSRRLAAELPAPRQAAALMETLARAIHHAHTQGVIHRDLKPANILLQGGPRKSSVGHLPFGNPKVTDFGLAKLIQDEPSHTRSGQIMGTPSYMAPEQASGRSKEIGPTADVYALGAILYEMLTGRPPFRADSPYDTIRQVIGEVPVRPTRLQSKAPRDLETICLKCLEKEPPKRYRTAADLADDLRRFLNHEPIVARPTPAWERGWKMARRRPAIATLMLLCVALTLGGLAAVLWQWGEAVEARRQMALKADAEALARLEAERNLYFHTIALADGEWQANHVRRVEELLAQCKAEWRGWEWSYLDGLCHAYRLKVPGKNAVVYSPDGRLLATALGNDVVVRDARRGTEIRRLSGHKSQVTRLAFAGNGRLASASDDKTARVWDPVMGREICTFHGHDDGVSTVAFGPTGAWVASAGGRVIQLWRADTGRAERTFAGPSAQVRSVALSPDGLQLAATDADGVLWIWETETGRRLHQQQRHTAAAGAVAYRPDGKQLVTASEDGTLRVWDAATGQEVRLLAAHAGPVNSIAFSPDGQRLASGGGDFQRPGEVKVWNAADGTLQRTYRGSADVVAAVSFHPGGGSLASVSSDAVSVWDLTADQQAFSLACPSGGSAIVVSPDEQRLAVACGDGTIRIWDAPPVSVACRTLHGHTDAVNALSFCPNGQWLVSAGDDQTVRLWDVTSGRQVGVYHGHGNAVWAVAFSPDNRRVASAGADKVVRVWEAESAQEIQVFSGHTDRINCLAFSPDGGRIASGSVDATVRIWDTNSGTELRQWHEDSSVAALAFSPDGQSVAAVGGPVGRGNGTLRDADTGHVHCRLSGQASRIMTVAFTPDGRRLVTAGWDQQVKIWDSSTGQEALTLRGHRGVVTSVAVSTDGKRIASVSEDETVRVWSTQRGP